MAGHVCAAPSIGLHDVSRTDVARRFVPVEQGRAFQTRGAVWVRFQVENDTDSEQAWTLDHPCALVDELDVWIDGATTPLTGGLARVGGQDFRLRSGH